MAATIDSEAKFEARRRAIGISYVTAAATTQGASLRWVLWLSLSLHSRAADDAAFV